MFRHDASNPGQSLPPELWSARPVLARRWPWHVRRTWAGLDCRALDLSPLATGAPALATLLHPFDRVEPLPVCGRWRRASRSRLLRAVANLAGGWPEQPLVAASSLRITPWPHQVAPTLAVLGGRATRLLVADGVGLGKTMTAALLLAELVGRGVCRRALVLVPAHLRDQWRDELNDRAGLVAEVVDGPALAVRAAAGFAGESAWSVPGIAILSMDFARQPTVLAGLMETPWDLLVVDEAHQASGDTARASAVARIARASRVSILLTATPHTGDRPAFRRLARLGGDDEPLRWFRHASALGPPRRSRRTRRWRLAPSAAESRLHAALGAYARRVERSSTAEARLAMVVLRKRALSSADALRLSLEHRRRLIGSDVGEQFLLPLEGPPGEADSSDRDQPAALGAPGLDDRSGELAALDDLIALSRSAAATWSKWRAIDRLLAMTAEPLILFTEYRDTLHALTARYAGRIPLATLHGGLDRDERRASIVGFTGGDVRLLVATDAAAEGLNLQARCRLVVNVELPWSPRVLEQRAGRVDRLGQARIVHAWQLVGRSGHEAMVVAALARRLEAIRLDVGPHGPDAAPTPASSDLPSAPEDEGSASVCRALSDLWRLRARSSPAADTPSRAPRARLIWLRARRRHRGLGRSVILIFTSPARGIADADQHVAVSVALARWPPGSPSHWLTALAEAATPTALTALRSSSALAARLAWRETLLLRHAASAHTAKRWQPSFFDRRAARIVEATRQDAGRVVAMHEQWRRELMAEARPARLEPVCALLVR